MCGKFLEVTARQPRILFRTIPNLSTIGTPLPEGLHFSRPQSFDTVDPNVSSVYELGLSSPMKLNGGQ